MATCEGAQQDFGRTQHVRGMLVNFQSTNSRWAGLGPYYAMFPNAFAAAVIQAFTDEGDGVLDPFAGRGTSVYAAATLGRIGYGVEINPVGWLYGRVKLRPASKYRVLSRLALLARQAESLPNSVVRDLPEFFRHCYSPRVLQFLVHARSSLRWRTSIVDGTLAAIILVHLHGKRADSLSNQMRQTKAMSPAYCIRWWSEMGLRAPDVRPCDFLASRVLWRYRFDRPRFASSTILFGDAFEKLVSIRTRMMQHKLPKAKLLLTSPPYRSVTNYNYDQWLRIWFLGGPPHPTYSAAHWSDSIAANWSKKFEHGEDYARLLNGVFKTAAELMCDDAVVYVRTDARDFTLDTTRDALVNAFPDWRLAEEYGGHRPFVRATQTALFGDFEPKPGEVDLVLIPKERAVT